MPPSDQGMEMGGMGSRRASGIGDHLTLEATVEAPPQRRRKKKKTATIGEFKNSVSASCSCFILQGKDPVIIQRDRQQSDNALRARDGGWKNFLLTGTNLQQPCAATSWGWGEKDCLIITLASSIFLTVDSAGVALHDSLLKIILMDLIVNLASAPSVHHLPETSYFSSSHFKPAFLWLSASHKRQVGGASATLWQTAEPNLEKSVWVWAFRAIWGLNFWLKLKLCPCCEPFNVVYVTILDFRSWGRPRRPGERRHRGPDHRWRRSGQETPKEKVRIYYFNTGALIVKFWLDVHI